MSALKKRMSWFGNRISDVADDAMDLHWSDVLHAIGLQRRRRVLSSVIPAIGFLIAGGAIGAGLGLIFAPASGRRLRQKVEDRISTLRERLHKHDGPGAMPNSASSP